MQELRESATGPGGDHVGTASSPPKGGLGGLGGLESPPYGSCREVLGGNINRAAGVPPTARQPPFSQDAQCDAIFQIGSENRQEQQR